MSNTVINMQGKNTLLAYVLWFFVGYLGIHKFYLRAPISGVCYLGLFVVGDLLWLVGLGWLLHIPLSILLIIDIFIIPGRVNRVNNGDAREIFANLNKN